MSAPLCYPSHCRLLRAASHQGGGPAYGALRLFAALSYGARPPTTPHLTAQLHPALLCRCPPANRLSVEAVRTPTLASVTRLLEGDSLRRDSASEPTYAGELSPTKYDPHTARLVVADEVIMDPRVTAKEPRWTSQGPPPRWKELAWESTSCSREALDAAREMWQYAEVNYTFDELVDRCTAACGPTCAVLVSRRAGGLRPSVL